MSRTARKGRTAATGPGREEGGVEKRGTQEDAGARPRQRRRADRGVGRSPRPAHRQALGFCARRPPPRAQAPPGPRERGTRPPARVPSPREGRWAPEARRAWAAGAKARTRPSTTRWRGLAPRCSPPRLATKGAESSHGTTNLTSQTLTKGGEKEREGERGRFRTRGPLCPAPPDQPGRRARGLSWVPPPVSGARGARATCVPVRWTCGRYLAGP